MVATLFAFCSITLRLYTTDFFLSISLVPTSLKYVCINSEFAFEERKSGVATDTIPGDRDGCNIHENALLIINLAIYCHISLNI